LLRSWSSGAEDDGSSSVLRNSSKEGDRNDDDNHYSNYSTNNDNDKNKNNARAVILMGSHGTFCSGLDLSANNNSSSSSSSSSSDEEEASSAGGDGEEMLIRMTTITNQLLSLPVVTIAAIDGYAMGGGAELTTATDLVVLSHTANIQFVHGKRGASTGWGGTRRLVSKVGRRCAIQLLLLGHCIRGDEEYTRSTIISAVQHGRMIYADAIANANENAYDATIRLIIHPLIQLPCSYSIRAIKSAISAADGDRHVINITDGTLNSSTNMAVKCEMESFMSVWGSKSNIDQIQITKDRLLKGRRSEEVEESK
jgi:ethylmalonyl-CoA/methylmalonyl-CoA decarboxylase